MRYANYVVDVVEYAAPAVVSTTYLNAQEVLTMCALAMDEGTISDASLMAVAGHFTTPEATVIYSRIAESA